ncbi:multicopper oxidase domain-containing protein [Streptosporangium canum]|uniref:multicopper oxidase domain-containing protein n=1 Tax=Streptosporangium canum TaxID=324952 RepID=UPI0033BE4CFD
MALLVGGGFWWLYSSTDISTVGKVAFTNPLKVPPLADSRLDDQGRRVFDLKMQPGTTQFEDGKPTETRGFNGSYLGPTLRAKRGEKVVVNGTHAPYQQVNDELVRLRLLNDPTARTLNFGFDDSRSFSLIATDGGLLNTPAPMERLQLSPTERHPDYRELLVTSP